jgi:hypothetical protein
VVAGPNPLGHDDDDCPPNATRLQPEGMTITQDPDPPVHPVASASRPTVMGPSFSEASGAPLLASFWADSVGASLLRGPPSLVASPGVVPLASPGVLFGEVPSGEGPIKASA